MERLISINLRGIVANLFCVFVLLLTITQEVQAAKNSYTALEKVITKNKGGGIFPELDL